jgi:hypothetical protein
MTQQEHLKHYLEFSSRFEKIVFIHEWLEDINYHTEAAMILAMATDRELKMLNDLFHLHIASNESSYKKERWNYFLKNNILDTDAIKAYQDYREVGNEYIVYRGANYKDSDLIGYRNIQDSFNVFSKIFGFGIENEWCSNKESFVESLKEIISTPNK